MRPLFAIVTCVTLVGGMALYMHTRETVAPPAEPVLEAASGEYVAEITPSSPLEPDPFALDPEDAASIRVLLNGAVVLERTGAAPMGEPLRTEPLPVLAEPNELYVEAFPPVPHAGGAQAVRLRVLRDGGVVGEATFWAEGGRAVTGTLAFTPEKKAKEAAE